MPQNQRSPANGAPCSLREACHRAGLDRDGRRCPSCPVRDLCQSELRWLVPTPPQRGLPALPPIQMVGLASPASREASAAAPRRGRPQAR